MNMVCIFIIIGLCCYLHDSIFTFLRGGHVICLLYTSDAADEL